MIETCEKVPHVNVSISCREEEEEQDNHKQGDFTPISGELRFQKLVRSHNCHHVDRDSISIVIKCGLMLLKVLNRDVSISRENRTSISLSCL